MSIVTCPQCQDGDVEVFVQPREPSVGIVVAYVTEASACESCGNVPNVDEHQDDFMDELTAWPPAELDWTGEG